MSALIVAAALQNKNQGIELMYIGSHKPQDKKLVESAGLQFRSISTGKFRRYFSMQNIADSFRFIKGIGEAQKILQDFNPDVIFAKGGYVALPVVLAAKRLKIPVVIHESDSRLGLTNRLAVASAAKVAVSFPVDVYMKSSPKLVSHKDKFIYTGIPLDSDIHKGSAKSIFNNRKSTILITGGSQGAKAINRVVFQALPELVNKYNVVHQTGELDLEDAKLAQKALPASLQKDYKFFDFAHDVYFAAIRSSNLVVSRAGSSIFSILALGTPMILIPLPGSANNHQHHNAEFLDSQGAAITVHQKDLTAETFINSIEQVMEDERVRNQLSANAEKLGKMNELANERIVDLIIKTAK